jgi:hypothetical protein
MIEEQRADRDIHAARLKVDEYTDRLYDLECANYLRSIGSPEHRAAVLMGIALADGSHTAAASHERALQTLRAARLEAEAAAAEREAGRADPEEAFEALLDDLAALPDGRRRRAVDRLAASVHVAPPEQPPAADPVLTASSTPPAPRGRVLRPT